MGKDLQTVVAECRSYTLSVRRTEVLVQDHCFAEGHGSRLWLSFMELT